MKHNYLITLFLLFALTASAQEAMVQVIHNSPTPATDSGPTVDIYLNGNADPSNPDISDLAFREATPFVSLPAGATQIHVVADGDDPATDTVFYTEAMLEADENYVIVAIGIAGDDDVPFSLAVKPGAKLESSAGNNDLLIFHGSPDAPSVIIDARDVATLESQLSFGEFGEYRTVPNADYIVDIRPGNDTTAIVSRYQAPLQSLGLDSVPLTVFASGLLGNTPAFGVFATLPDGTTLALPDTAIAEVQIIHNSPFADMSGGPEVDIFVNGEAPADGPLKGIAFRTATPFLDLPGNVDFTFDVVPAGGTLDQSIFTLSAGELENSALTVMAHGIAGDAQNPFNLAVNPGARPFVGNPGAFEFNVFHGSPDAPAVDIDAVTVGEIIDSLAFGAFNDDYFAIPPDLYFFGVRAHNDPNTIATFRADVSSLADVSATVMASGFLANQAGSPFGLFVVLADGTVVELPVQNVATVQIVHNAPVAELVDVWLGGATKAVPNFEYQDATSFLTIPIDSSISITAAESTDTAGNFLTIPPGTLTVGESYYVVAAGDALENFGIEVFAGARTSSSTGTGIDIVAFHGSPDAPAVDINARGIATLFADLQPRTFADDYVNVPAGTYSLDVTLPGEDDAIFSFVAPLEGLDDIAVLAMASGYASSVEPDSAFRLLLVSPNGAVVNVTMTSQLYLIHAIPSLPSADIYFGGQKFYEDVPFRGFTGFTELFTQFDISINSGNSTGPEDGVQLVIPANTLTRGRDHYVVLHGDGSAEAPFEASFIDTARTQSSEDGFVDAIAFHALAGLGEVDIRNGAVQPFPVIIPDLGYGEFSDYLQIQDGADFLFRFTDGADSTNTIATFSNGVQAGDETVILIPAGNVDSDPLYNLYMYTAQGNLFTSVPVALQQIIHNALPDAVNTADIWLTSDAFQDIALQGVPFLGATSTSYLPTRTDFTVGIAAGGSQGPQDAVVEFDVRFEDGEDYTIIAHGGSDGVDDPVGLAAQTGARFEALNSDFELQLFHGTPDAGTVDVSAGGAVVADDLEYTQFAGYLELGGDAFDVTISDGTGTTVVGTWNVPVDEWLNTGYTSGTIFTTGLLNNGVGLQGNLDTPFQLWIAFNDGTTEQLGIATSLQELETILTGMRVMPNPVSTNAVVEFTIDEQMEIRSRIIGIDGRIVQEQDLGQLGRGTHTMDIDAFDLPAGTYQLQMLSDRGSITTPVVVVR